MKIVLDSNILFSAIIRDSKTRELILEYSDSFLFPEYIFTELQEASNRGRDIEIRNLSYEGLEINKNVSLTGQGTSTVLIVENKEKSLIRINDKNFKINNLKIKDSPIGIEIYKGKLEVENVEFNNSVKTACYTKGAELIFKNSYIYDSNSAIKAINSSGEINNSIIKNNKKSGIDLRESKFVIKNNIITDNKSYGVFADINSEIEIENNFINNNNGFNVRIEKEGDIYR